MAPPPRLQRWRDFLAHAAAYTLFNLIFANSWRGPITDAEIQERMRRYETTTGTSPPGSSAVDGEAASPEHGPP